LGNKTSTSNVIYDFSDTTYSITNPFVLNGEAQDSVKNVLYWNEEPSWASIIGSYNIYRSYEGSGYVLIGSQTAGSTTYTDSLAPLSYFKFGNGVFCYLVIPTKNSSDMYGCVDTSNSICLQQFPKFVLPNSFTPNGDGLNDIFIATKLFIDESGYLLTIFNRWGQRIFETANPSEGWDGRYKGFYAPPGVYVYHIQFSIKEGSVNNPNQEGTAFPFEKAGTVVLLR
jgi:gliding motility-associated-like protein